MERQFVRLGRDGGLVTVELINSKTLNILGSGGIEELTRAFHTISQERDVRVVVLRGAGEMPNSACRKWPSESHR